MKLHWPAAWGARPIGLDIGSSCIKVCQLRGGGPGTPEITAALAAPRRAGESIADIAARLPELLARHGFKGRDLVLAVPPDAQLISMLQVPPANSGAPLEAIVRSELARAHKRGVESIEFSWWELPQGERATEGSAVIAAGCGHEQSVPLIEAFERAGFQVTALDLPAAALGRACGPLLAPAPCINAIVDLGWSRPSLVLLRGSRIVYLRDLPDLALLRVHAKLKERLRFSDDEATVLLAALAQGERPALDPDLWLRLDVLLAEHAAAVTRELEISMRYALHRYTGGHRSRVLIVGGGAHLPNLAGDLRTSLGCEVLAPRLADLARVGIATPPSLPPGLLTMAAGLSAHAESASRPMEHAA